MDGASFLLLLPPPPSPPTISALKSLYGDTLLQVLEEADSASKETTGPSVLDIALACPHLAHQNATPRADLYATTQSIISTLYKLICLTAAQEKIDIEDFDGIDVRILPVAWSPDASLNCFSGSSYGPVVDLPSLAASQRPWQYAFGVENDEGETFVRSFVAAKQAAANNQAADQSAHVCSGHSCSGHSHSHSHANFDTQTSSARKHSHVAVGGTFDHLHIGHKLLLTMTAFALDQSQDESVMIVGITGDELLKNKKHAEQLESWTDRQKSAHRFLEAILDYAGPDAAQPTIDEINEPGPNGHAINVRYPNGLIIRYVEIWDAYGPTITDEDVSALVISAETRAGGKAVNDKRMEKSWSALDVFEVDVLDASEAADPQSLQGFQNKLSSTEIRKKLAEKTKSS